MGNIRHNCTQCSAKIDLEAIEAKAKASSLAVCMPTSVEPSIFYSFLSRLQGWLKTGTLGGSPSAPNQPPSLDLHLMSHPASLLQPSPQQH